MQVNYGGKHTKLYTQGIELPTNGAAYHVCVIFLPPGFTIQGADTINTEEHPVMIIKQIPARKKPKDYIALIHKECAAVVLECTRAKARYVDGRCKIDGMNVMPSVYPEYMSVEEVIKKHTRVMEDDGKDGKPVAKDIRAEIGTRMNFPATGDGNNE